MKTMTGILALAGTAALAAPQVSVQARTDYRYDLRSQADDALRDNNGFDLQYARLDVNGAVAPSLKYRMRLRFDFPALKTTSTTKSTTKDAGNGTYATTSTTTSSAVVKDSLKGASDYVDYLYAKQSLPQGFAVTAGKFFSGRCGWEGEAAGYDLYQTTLTYASSSAMHSVVGVQPSWEGAGQTVSVTLANSGVGWTDAANKDVQRFLMAGAAWKGTFLEGLVQPNISLYYVPVKATDDARYLTSVGVRSKIDIIQTDFEWKSLADTAKSNGNLPFTQSWSAMVKADMGMLRPQMKFFYDNVSVLDEKTSISRVGFTPVLEVFPFEKTNFRWHAGFSLLNVNDHAKDESKMYNKVFAGMAMNLDIMK